MAISSWLANLMQARETLSLSLSLSSPKCLQLLVTLFLEDGVGSTARQELHKILHAHHWQDATPWAQTPQDQRPGEVEFGLHWFLGPGWSHVHVNLEGNGKVPWTIKKKNWTKNMAKRPLTAFLCSRNVYPIADREFLHQGGRVLSGDDIPHIAPLVLGTPSSPTGHLHVFLGTEIGPSAGHLMQAITTRVLKLREPLPNQCWLFSIQRAKRRLKYQCWLFSIQRAKRGG